MITLRSIPKRYCHHLQCYLKSITQSFCTNTNTNNNEDNKSNTNESKTKNWIEAPTLPCFLSQFDALEAFNIWAKRQWFAPSRFKKDGEKYVHVIHKYYVPYWHFDATAQSKYHASISPDKPPTKESMTSCQYSSSQPEMQCIASDRLTSDESLFLSIPLGPTQFQRMTHHVDDLLPDTVNEATATKNIREWLETHETQRVQDFIMSERMHKPVIQCNVQLNCRKAYMPAYIIWFNPFVLNPKDTPDAISEDIPDAATYRCIVHGYSGNIQGPRIYSLVSCLKFTVPLSIVGIVPVGAALFLPLPYLSVTSLASGLSLAGIMQSPIFTSRLYFLDGNTLDTQQTRLKTQQMEEKEVEDILRAAENSWGFHTHRNRPVAREQQKTSQESYERYDQQTQYYSQKVQGGYDAEGRPIGRRAVRFIELYETLGISPNASTREIQQAFTKLAKQYHPDQLQQETEYEKEKGGNKFQKILLAFQVLKDPERRKKYDVTGDYKEDKKRNKPNTTNQPRKT